MNASKASAYKIYNLQAWLSETQAFGPRKEFRQIFRTSVSPNESCHS